MSSTFKIISVGYRCISASFLQLLGIKTESYPFDWLVSSLSTVQHCIETNFIHFLQPNNYITRQTETSNTTDDSKFYFFHETTHINTFYNPDIHDNTGDIQTYRLSMGLNHYDVRNPMDYEYYQRCIQRLYNFFHIENISKYYLYFHPIMGIHDFHRTQEDLLKEIETFHAFMLSRTNIFGICFILIKHNHQDPHPTSVVWKETPTSTIFLLYCNEQFADAGAPFMGDHDTEKNEVLSRLEHIISIYLI